MNFKLIRRDLQEAILIKGKINQETITMLNIYSPNFGAPNFIKSVLMKFEKQINTNPKIADDFSTPLSLTDRPSRQKINRKNLKTK